MTISHNRLSVLVLAAATLTGCAGNPQAAVQTSPAIAGPPRSSPAAIAQARADSLRRPYTKADIHFMSAMIGHHAQAIVIARWAPDHGASPAIQRLAERIITAQRDEIGIMQSWLRDRLQPVPEATPAGMPMEMDGAVHHMLMPGMLTESQMKQLDDARGKDFDRLFLTYMIQHHKGAVTMVRELFATDGAGHDEIVFKFASDVNVDQDTEIARMELMLAAVLAGGTVQ
jgi:uncharacterized protein (DUF305 family)